MHELFFAIDVLNTGKDYMTRKMHNAIEGWYCLVGLWGVLLWFLGAC